MSTIFLGLAFWNVVFFGITIWLGVTHQTAHWRHEWAGVLTGIYTLLTHCIVMMHFMGSGKGIKEAVETHNLPDDPQTGYVRRTKKFKGRTSGLATLSCLLIIGVVWLGGAKDVGILKGMTHAWVAYLVVAFNLYAFYVEYRVIAENTAMIREIDARIAGDAGRPVPHSSG